jgi:hypothetical protein
MKLCFAWPLKAESEVIVNFLYQMSLFNVAENRGAELAIPFRKLQFQSR